MLPLDQLQEIYKDVPKSERVIVHCQTGQRASYAYLVLRALGYDDVANYGDGWRVYGSDLKLRWRTRPGTILTRSTLRSRQLKKFRRR